jgi:F-type H+-transporting ATPase subunit b
MLPVLALALAAAPAWAAEPGGEQPSPVSVDLPTVITAIIVFLILAAILAKVAWRPILDGLQKREETIRKAVDDAEKASADARAMIAEYEQKMAGAAEEARAILEEGKKDAEDVKRRIEEEAGQRAEETLARALKEIDRAKDKAYEELLTDVTAIVTEGAARVVRKHLTVEDNAAIVEEVVRDFTRSGRGDEA